MAASAFQVIVIRSGTGRTVPGAAPKARRIRVAVYKGDRTRTDGLQGYRGRDRREGKRALRANLAPKCDSFVATGGLCELDTAKEEPPAPNH